MLEILARLLGLQLTAKRYHWMVVGSSFNGDHALFDRIADAFDFCDLGDKLAEVYFMSPAGRENIDQLNSLEEKMLDYRGKVFNASALNANENHAEEMVKELSRLCNELRPLLDTEVYGQGAKTVLDDIAFRVDQSLGLMTGRLKATEFDNQALSTAVNNLVNQVLQ